MEDLPTPTTPGQSEASWRHAGGTEIKRFGRVGSDKFCSPQGGGGVAVVPSLNFHKTVCPDLYSLRLTAMVLPRLMLAHEWAVLWDLSSSHYLTIRRAVLTLRIETFQ